MAVAENHLIELLPREDRLRLQSIGVLVELKFSEILSMHGERTLHVYFPTDGFISVLTRRDDTPPLEVGMVGREGMLGAQLVLGVVTAPLQALVQGAGAAWRIDTLPFQRELARSTALQLCLHHYIHVLMAQLTASATCLRFHKIGPRLARWLLMSQDRAHADSFHVTHESLAYMLGVRRVGITVAASAMQRAGLIEYHRGELTVLNRGKLEAAACSCYAADGQAYTEIMH
ncbi:Crp/Fnr family transcriptional regulator [Thiomonas sp. FB-Cd]|uniref:Crp/Fnr family transcriptional regulator n=1 Tax=Thiomonas sp. FB-Cd TaxID=1158292 RepID=UPI0004DF27A9|nr:Crp/Fnr family transcriptional regulator [Thiomonas sp. FB-Cd]